ncbi:MAG: M50 family metallopeptidase [Elusimicrobia bacterium]|nr:M50 family metallopeptidase [Elusimicrobiota bacterium]
MWPFCWGTLRALPTVFVPFGDIPEGTLYLLFGVVTYLVAHLLLAVPIRTYVFGHELTHALAAWLVGGKVRKFHVSRRGGSVTVTQSNLFVALAPYLFPLYTLCVVLAYAIAQRFVVHPFLRPTALFLVGLTLAFHGALTVQALRQRQPDVTKSGSVLSYSLIWIGNCAVLVLLLRVLFPAVVSAREFFNIAGHESLAACSWLGNTCWEQMQALRLRIGQSLG